MSVGHCSIAWVLSLSNTSVVIMVIYLGCGALFNWEGNLHSHYTQSRNCWCVLIWESLGRILQAVYIEDENDKEKEKDKDKEDQIDVDQQAYFVGDYYGAEYRPGNFPGFQEEHDYVQNQDPTVDDGPDGNGDDYKDDFSGDEEDYM